jgi:S1-C subfamily serine protease
MKMRKSLATGSGFIVDSSGKIATNLHVIDGAYTAKVKLANRSVYDVSNILAYDLDNDLALLKIAKTELKPVTLGDSDFINTGDIIYAIGNPFGLDNTISDGLISTKTRIIDEMSFIQISAPISEGSSGGIILNEQGETIGITPRYC